MTFILQNCNIKVKKKRKKRSRKVVRDLAK